MALLEYGKQFLERKKKATCRLVKSKHARKIRRIATDAVAHDKEPAKLALGEVVKNMSICDLKKV